MASCDEDLVVLDTRADHYSCLPEAAPYVRLTPGVIDGPEEILDHLEASGLVALTAGAERRPLPSPPVRALSLDGVIPSAGDQAAVLGGMVAAWTKGPGRRPLSALIITGSTPSSRDLDLALTSRLTAAFVRSLPWDPAQGACLYRAWLLRHILRRRGQAATWVFGVRTWPFGAHCWLQVGDQVLDDDPDRVARYTPIMAV